MTKTWNLQFEWIDSRAGGSNRDANAGGCVVDERGDVMRCALDARRSDVRAGDAERP